MTDTTENQTTTAAAAASTATEPAVTQAAPGVSNVAALSTDQVQALTIAQAGAVVPPAAPTRSIDQIRADLQTAKTKHAAAQAEVDTQTGILQGLVHELRAAITYFDHECSTVEHDVSAVGQGVLNWVEKEAQAIGKAL